jgi:tetratricopeptide (TPR) repeat protein
MNARALPTEPRALVQPTWGRAMAAANLRRFDEAERGYEQVIAILAADDPTDPQIDVLRGQLGVLSMLREDYATARTIFADLVERYRGRFGADHHHFAFELMRLGVVEGKLGAHERGLEHLQTARAILERALGESHDFTVEAIVSAGKLLIAIGRPGEGRSELAHALAIVQRHAPDQTYEDMIRMWIARADWDLHRDRRGARRLVRELAARMQERPSADAAVARAEAEAWLARHP